MSKKFKHAPPILLEVEAAQSLAEYFHQAAPELLLNHPLMQGINAVRFWQDLFQPLGNGEAKRLINGVWRWPYAERLVYLAREFNRLNPAQQAYVLKAAKARIWWRGDDMAQFKGIVQAHLQYQRLSDEERASYRRGLLQAAQGLAVVWSGRKN